MGGDNGRSHFVYAGSNTRSRCAGGDLIVAVIIRE